MNDNKSQAGSIFYTRLVGTVEDKSIKEVMKDIDQGNSQKGVREIVMTISTLGGWLYDAFALYDHIKKSKIPVDIIAEGYCQSAGVMLLQSARKRISTPHTVFMVHPTDIRQDERRPYAEYLSIVEQSKRNHDLSVKLTIERAGLSKEDFEKLYDPRKYFNANEALELKLIDEIIE